MHQETRERALRARADKSKDNPNTDESHHKLPGPTQLIAVHEPKKNARHHNARNDSKPSRKHGKEIPAKNSFFNERRNEHGHSHKREGHIAILEEVLNRRIFGSFDRDRDDHDDQRKAAAQEK